MKEKHTPKYLYSTDQIECIEEHIEKNFGKIDKFMRDNSDDDMQVDIYIISPTIEKPYYTLVTVGMGAYKMSVPEGFYERIELVICLPASWEIENDKMECFWPFHLLGLLSRLPMEDNAWLGWGHTVNYNVSFAPDTDFCGIILFEPPYENDVLCFKNSSINKIKFYQVYPLYDIEIDFACDNNASALFNEWGDDMSHVVDIDRSPVVSRDYKNIVDTVEDHSSKIEKKGLDLPDICGANHIAAYLLWCIKHKKMSIDFTDFFKQEIKEMLTGKYDVRKFIINSLGGELTKDIFSDIGRGFTEFYYRFYSSENSLSYPSDVDKMAYDYFGKERYDSDEFCDEAYLFVPYDNDYFKAMNKYINRAYKKYLSIPSLLENECF